MKLIFGSEKWLSQDTRLIKRLYRAESGGHSSGSFVFDLQYLWFRENKWLEVARFDNYVHETKRTGVHIHKFGNSFTEFKNMSFTEAEEYVIEIGEKIRQKMLLGDDDGKN